MEAVLELARKPVHVREIARRIRSSPATVARLMDRMLKENAVDHQMQGRNKVFFLKDNLQARNTLYSAERYKLAKLVAKYPELGIILDDTAKAAAGKMVVLFGSYAKFSARQDSDIDIYVSTEDRRVKASVEGVNSRISVKIGRFDISSPLIREIVKDHVIIRGIDEFYERAGFPKQA
jgi:predicted nucleotidyltransferase